MPWPPELQLPHPGKQYYLPYRVAFVKSCQVPSWGLCSISRKALSSWGGSSAQSEVWAMFPEARNPPCEAIGKQRWLLLSATLEVGSPRSPGYRGGQQSWPGAQSPGIYP